MIGLSFMKNKFQQKALPFTYCYLGRNIYNQTTKKVLHFNDVEPFLF